jgi:DNA processing protein
MTANPRDPLESTPDALIGPLNDVERANAPQRLFVAGDRTLLETGARISVVGTRRPTDLGERRTRDLVEVLVKRGITVVSGLALGIDTIAHVHAMESGGRTIAVLGTPIDDYHPPRIRALQQRIASEHLVVSQFDSGTPTLRTNFPQRNRTMALLSDATIIIEAGDGSGTLHQGWEAIRLGRPLFVLESLTKRADLEWPAEMIRYGAQVLSKANLEIALDEVPRRSGDRVTL